MSGTIPSPPKYRHYKPKNLAVVRLDGRDIYLGRYGSTESWEKYGRVIAEWRAYGTLPPSSLGGGATVEAEPDGPSVNEVVLAFWRHATVYYRRSDGSPTGELDNLRLALRPLKQLYGRTPAREFSPKALKAVRQSMVDSGLCRRTVNQRVGRIVRVYRFAVENELVPAGVHHALKAVAGLKAGRSGARESEPVKPVPEPFVDAVRPHLSRQLWAMVELQRLTGMRSGEVTIMRTCDLDTSGRVWVYTPKRHKTAHHGHERKIHIGPRAQAVLGPWLRTDLVAYIFQPKEAEAERSAERRRNRRTPLTPSQRARKRKTKPRKTPGDHYDSRAYAHAVKRACKKAGVLHWHPHQLRHNVATQLRKEFGLDATRAVLGHSDADTTTIYAERDAALAAGAMERVG